jgi:hypothetical protein
MHAYTRIHTHTHAYTRIHTHTHAYTCIHSHTHAYTLIHTQTRTVCTRGVLERSVGSSATCTIVRMLMPGMQGGEESAMQAICCADILQTHRRRPEAVRQYQPIAVEHSHVGRVDHLALHRSKSATMPRDVRTYTADQLPVGVIHQNASLARALGGIHDIYVPSVWPWTHGVRLDKRIIICLSRTYT